MRMCGRSAGKWGAWAGALFAGANLGSVTVHADPPGAGELTFERDIRPILKQRCFHCHGEAGKKKGDLDLRLRGLIAKGGESGAAIVPGNPAGSLMLERVSLGEMPPGDEVEKLGPEEVARIERWIAEGAKTARPEPDEIGEGHFITEEERGFWSYQPIRRPEVPEVPEVPEESGADLVRTAVDRFLLARLGGLGESFARPSDRRTLLRRASFDLLGLPPPEPEVERFLADTEPGAWERLIDRLLASPHYGERWGRHWLDVAGYADSDGAAGDGDRPYAYRYRDYVIRSFNGDKPFDRFVLEQLAGDELAGPLDGKPTPEQAEWLIATGFLQTAPDTLGSAEDPVAAHDQLVADSLEIVSSSLLGLTVGCARCHDHRYDPISQEDYYRFRAIFEPAYARPNWQEQNRKVEWLTAEDEEDFDRQIDLHRRAVVATALDRQMEKVPKKDREAARIAAATPAEERSAEQTRLVAEHRLDITLENVATIDRGAKQELNRLENLQKGQRGRIGFLHSVRESGARVATSLFLRGDPRNRGPVVSPGELAILGGDERVKIPEDDPALPGSGRRLAYARHLTGGDHPLLARVIVNRVWMHHFGEGLVPTPGDFGLGGDPPSHPELLDWLAREFMDHGWSLKHLHRILMASGAYRQGTARSTRLVEADPENHLLGGFPVRRLEAEVLRDAILAVSGSLNPKAFGRPVPVTSDPAGEIVVGMEGGNGAVGTAPVAMHEEANRRSIYIQSRRTTPLTFLEMFDSPVMEPNCEARTTSTAAPQSLVLMNSPFVLGQSKEFAERVRRESGPEPGNQVRRAWELAFSRPPSDGELADALAFLRSQTAHFQESPPQPFVKIEVPGSRSQETAPQPLELLVDEASRLSPEMLALSILCHMLFISNEFLYTG